MASMFRELLAMASSITTQFLRLTRLEWTRSIVLRHLKTILWQRPKTLNDMPYDVVFVLSYYLSVRDLCNLRETSTQLSSLVRDRSIWLLALRDILEVRPIPRLSFSLDEMDLDEIMTATLRLTTLDRKLRGVDQITTFKIARSFDADGLIPVPLPGGRHFLTLQNSERNLVVHDWGADTLRDGRLLIPPSEHPIYLWRAVPVSSTTVNVVVVSLEELEECDDLGEPLPRTHITIYQCNADEGTSKQIDYFSVNPKIWALFVDTTHLALLWDDPDDCQYTYIRMYTKGLQTDIMRLKDPQCPCRGSITMISQGHFIVVNGDGALHRMFTLPSMRPIASTHVDDPSVYHPHIWRSVQGGDCLQTPRVTSLQPASSDSPPPKFIVWTGRCRHIMTLSSLDGADVSYNVDRQRMWPDAPFSVGDDETSSMGRFSGVHHLPDRSIRLFALPITYPTSRGPMRLDIAPSSLHIQVTELVCSSLLENEFIYELSYDEESGRLYIAYEDAITADRRIVLGHLSASKLSPPQPLM
ncbi:F-box domain-containing protein [Pleurotus pulmonarius]